MGLIGSIYGQVGAKGAWKIVKVAERLSEARNAVKQGDMATAQAHLFNALVDFPKNKKLADGLADLMGGDAKTKALNKEYFVAMALNHRGDFEEAEAKTRVLLKKAPDRPEILNLMGSIAATSDRPHEALQFFTRALELNPRKTSILKNLGKAQLRAGEVESALQTFKRLLDAAPDDPTAHRRVAAAQRHAGDNDGARETVEKALERFPEDVFLLEFLAIVKKYDQPDHPDILRLTELLKSGKLNKEGVRKLSISAARSLEKTGDPARSIRAFKHGNALRKEELDYDFSRDKKVFDKIRANFDAPLEPLGADDDWPKPIFIVGMPRSGTSLMEQILASHSQVFGAGELGWWNNNTQAKLMELGPTRKLKYRPEELTEMRNGYRALLKSLSNGEKYVTDKMPMNFRWIGLMSAVFPEAPILHMCRDPRATCWSVFKLPFPAGGLGFTFDANDVVKFYGEYRSLMDFWDEVLPGRVSHVSYEHLTENQESETRRLLELCNLPWEDATLEFHKSKRSVATASTSQVREKMYKGSSEAWREFAPYLPELFDALPEKY